MKCAYEAANGVEAHMIANLLEQQSIETRIDGEYLAGGVGELPAAGLVRVMVEEESYARARQIVLDWEASSPPVSATPKTSRARNLWWVGLGAVVSAMAMLWIYRPRILSEGVDFNRDGRPDQTHEYTGNLLRKVAGDANLDGRVDYLFRYEAGRLVGAEFDVDGDGAFDTVYKYDRYGEVIEAVRR